MEWSRAGHTGTLISGGERQNEPLSGSSWEARDLTSVLLSLIYLFVCSFMSFISLSHSLSFLDCKMGNWGSKVRGKVSLFCCLQTPI